ncbi:MAG: acetyl-CoA decarbonylase/synthase complex subunit delta [Desulfobacterales bacterium]|nr:acetyl-CoA decarbonylase/synthase complex subunit delta [Desulfobacterales bacterium]
MGFEFYKESYTGSIKEISLGKGDKAITVGGDACYPFYQFEGKMPRKPQIAMEIWDMEPDEWPDSVLAYFKDVVSDIGKWAKKCVDEYGAEAIVLQLKSIDPNGKNAGPDDAVASVKKVLAAVKVPLIIWGSANAKKDEEVFKKIAEVFQGEKLTIGPVDDKNYKGVGASAMGYGHTIIASSPIDVNLAKQVNILLENLGMPTNRMLIDPTTGGLGYGLEYSYSVMERIRMAALAQGDDKLQLPIINNIGNEVWKCKEAKQSAQDAPTLGDPEKRGIMMEAVGAVSYLMAGSGLLVMRHPEAIRLAKSYITLLSDGGMATNVGPISKKLGATDINLAALSPALNLTIEEEKKAAAPAAKAPEVKAPPKAAEAPKVAAAPKVEVKAAPTPEVKVDDTAAKAKAEADAKAKAEAAAKTKADADAKAKADATAKAKAEAEAKAKAEVDAKLKAEADAKAKRDAEEEAIRQKREQERMERAKAKEVSSGPVKKTPASVQKNETDRMLEKLDRLHRRVL